MSNLDPLSQKAMDEIIRKISQKSMINHLKEIEENHVGDENDRSL